MKFNVKILSIIILFCIYHYFIHNGLEKLFSQTYFDYKNVKRPIFTCSKDNNFNKLRCIGMPSGHAETSSVLFFLLYFYKIIPLWFCLLFISIFSIQRITSHMHTVSQVIVGCTLGLLYALIYKHFNLSVIGFLVVFFIGFILVLLSIFKIDQQVYGPVPEWVDKSMYESIKTKQNSPLYIKIGTLYINALIQNLTFLKWNELETSLDKLIDKIKQSEINYDAVVGIKTGGAIISDYISLKLGLPNYKIKLSREEYNCNKTSVNTLDDIFKKNLYYKQGEFSVCEGINDNLEGKNIILIDEIVSTGKTMEESYYYLKDYKHVNVIYPACLAFNKSNYKGSIPINNVLFGPILIFPWGYDN
jgi:hypoxanthine phosphoribosyltransferase